MISALTILLIYTLFGVVHVSAAQDSTEVQIGVIEVTIAPIRVSDSGDLIIAVYREEDSWLELDRAFAKKIIPVRTDTVIVVFKDVPFGQYALSVIHDKNKNAKFDMRWFPFPKPKEGAGVSNNNRRMGKPRYDRALFTVADDTISLQVEMAY